MSSIQGPGSDPLGVMVEVDAQGNPVPGKQVDFHFNPDTINVAAATGGSKSSIGASGANKTSTSGSGSSTGPSRSSTPPSNVQPTSLTFNKIYFDGGFTTSVWPECKQLFEWFKPASGSNNSTSPPPQPRVDLWLGTKYKFRGYITQISIEFQMFNPAGEPTRALITNLAVREDVGSAGPQNPTSGGIASYSSVVLGAGDTLQSVAYTTYGDPRYWRQLALINEFDDPLRLQAGTAVMLPTIDEIDKVAS
jgi:nucleoid-associated protein YgaU